MRLVAGLALTCASFTIFAARVSADVRVVAPSGGSFTQISQAIAAANDDDVILVKAGTYGGFAVANKSLSIVADTAAAVIVTGQVQITGLNAARTAVLSGLDVHPTVNFETDALRLFANVGSVRVQDCVLHGADMTTFNPYPTNSHGASVTACTDVAFTRCTLTGGHHAFLEGTHGLWMSGSWVAVSNSTLTGSRGGDANSPFGGYGYGYSGGNGAEMTNHARLYTSACILQGGDGGNGPGGSHNSGGVGLVGIGDALAFVRSTSFFTGLPSPGASYFLDASSSLVVHPSTARSVDALAITRENSTLVLHVKGEPGDQVALSIGPRSHFVARNDLQGVSLLQRTAARSAFPSGLIGGSGTLDVVLPIADLGPGVQSKVVQVQGVFTDASGQTTLGSSTSLVLLDSAF